jgi:hypothetical protein
MRLFLRSDTGQTAQPRSGHVLIFMRIQQSALRHIDRADVTRDFLAAEITGTQVAV